jgi:hypothetical protein
MRITFFLWMICMSCVEAYASQSSFKRELNHGVVRYNYVWQNMEGETFKTNFGLYADDIKTSLTEFEKFNQNELKSFSKSKILNFVKYNAPYGIDASFNTETEQVTFKSKLSRNKLNQNSIDKFMERLEEEQQKITTEYFRERYYNYNSKNNSVRPAHGMIAKRYVTAMRPVAQALAMDVRGQSSRDITNHILNFIQSIPYDTLEDIRTTNGAGFQTPYGVLHKNKGDCDSKSVMFAAIMRNLYPYARIVVVYVPGHALVGFDYQKGKGDYAIQVEGSTFVLAEPVGPKKTKLGQVSPKALQVMRRGAYSFEEVPY